MILKILILSGTISLIVSCTSQPKQSKESTPATEVNPYNCYRYVNNNDTVLLKTINTNGQLTGSLVYNLYEKDKNTGTIHGEMKGELLLADYSFLSEGATSVRQVAFKKNGDTFVEGYGDVEDKDGKTTFKNIDSLHFNNSIILKKVDCEK